MPKKSIYLDYAAATPLDPKVEYAMAPYLKEKFFNPASLYRAAREVKTELELARAKIAKTLGAQPSEIIFTAGATESVNLAIQGVAKAHPKGRFLCSATEHHAVLNTVAAVGAWRGGGIVKVKPNGLIDLTALEKAIDEKTVLISIAYANNETGTIQPMNKISELVKKVRADRAKTGNRLPLLWHTDASAAAGYLSLAVDRLGIDLLSLGGGKIYGPSDSGILYVRRGVELEPVIYGGGQEKGKRGGTVNVAAAVGLATALELVQRRRYDETKRLAELRDQAITELTKTNGVTLNGDAKSRLPGNINLSVDCADGETLVLYLDEAGLQVSTGAACTIGRAEPSHVLLSMGLTAKQANSNLRITFGQQTTKTDIEYLAKTFPEVVARVRSLKS